MERWEDFRQILQPVMNRHKEYVLDKPIRTGTGWEFRVEIGEAHRSPVVLSETFSENIYSDIVQAIEIEGFTVESSITDPDGSFVLRVDCRDRKPADNSTAGKREGGDLV